MHRAITGSRSKRRFILRRAGKCPEQETRTMIRFELKWQLKLDHSTCLKKAWPFLYYSLRKESNLKQVKPVGQWFYSVATVQDIGFKKTKQTPQQLLCSTKNYSSDSMYKKLSAWAIFVWLSLYFIYSRKLHYRSIVYCIKHSVVFYSNCATLVYIASIQVCAIFGDYIKKTVTDSLV